MSTKCLVLTDEEDETRGHLPFVSKHLPPDTLIVIDPIVAILEGKGLTFTVQQKRASLVYDDKPLNAIGAVWDRRPTPIKRARLGDIQPDYHEYVRKSVNELANQLISWYPDALHLPDYYASIRAESKSLQLRKAAGVGFTIPETIFTSDAKQAQSFVRARESTAIKGFVPFGPTLNGNPTLFFCRKVDRETDIDFRRLHIGPAIFQQAIDVDFELRITVVGSEVFAAKIGADIESTLSNGVRDWRIGNYSGGLSIEAFELPQKINKKCIDLTKALGLNFGAIDMIVDKSGKWWFLEINPNGQWAFVEHKTQQPIGKAIADLLLSACG